MTRAAAFLFSSLVAQAAGTAYWEMNSFQEFIKGRFQGISLTRDGRLLIAPRTDTLFTSEQPVIWSIARGVNSETYLATGHRGQLYRVDAAGKSELIWTAPEPEVFALVIDAKGVLYAGTSPGGKIYRIEGGKATAYFEPKTKYIWSLASGRDGALYAGTGEEGKIFRITGPNSGEVWYETGQSHVTSMAFDREQRLLAGTDPNGILYRITEKDKAFALYDSNLPEIRAIVPAADGSLYVAALGGAFGRKQAGAQGAVSSTGSSITVTAAPTSITVTEEAARVQGGVEIKPKPEAGKPPAAASAPAVAASAVLDVSGVDKAAIYRIHPDNLVETLWVSKEENIYDLAPLGSEILFSTDGQGRVYRLEADRKPTLLVETREGEATRLIPLADGILAATSHRAKLLRIGSQTGASGVFESPVHDATNAARWGRLAWRGVLPQGAKLVIRTRTGNSARPDRTWSDWSAPIEASGTPISSPNARYIQWKAELIAGASRSPELDGVIIAYLPQNSQPVVKSITVNTQAVPAAPAKPGVAGAAAPNTVYSITVTDTGDATATSAGNPTQTVNRASTGQLVLSWQAEDPDGDKMSYSIYFRGEEERQWKLLKTNWSELTLTLDGDSLADGKYHFRIVATDAPSNPASQAREGELISAPVLVDNTPPQVKPGVPRVSGGNVEFDVLVEDTASAIRRAECSIDAGPWMPLQVEDGVADSARERFRGVLSGLTPGEHLLVIRAFDAAGNAGLAKIVLR